MHVTFVEKGEAKSTVVVSHERLADAREAERTKAYWRERVGALQAERGGERLTAISSSTDIG